MLAVFFQILPLFLIIFIGGVFGYFNKSFNQTTVSELNRFAYFVGFPSIILNSFMVIDDIPIEEVRLAFVNILILVLFTLLVIFIINKVFKNKHLRNTYFVCAFFGNIAYLGYPLITSLNQSYSTSVSLHIAGYLIVIFTLGIAKLEVSKNEGVLNYKNLLTAIVFNPLLIATFVGILITTLHLPIPVIGKKVVKVLSASASPVVLFALGVFMTQNKLVKTTLFHAMFISGIKLLILPFVYWLFAALVFVDLDMTVSIIIATMPVAFTPFVLAEIYDMDKKIVANAIIISTILGILIIPLVANMLQI